ncbi:hypothetical protein [Candidatus Harpocratesius sp.]
MIISSPKSSILHLSPGVKLYFFQISGGMVIIPFTLIVDTLFDILSAKLVK